MQAEHAAKLHAAHLRLQDSEHTNQRAQAHLRSKHSESSCSSMLMTAMPGAFLNALEQFVTKINDARPRAEAAKVWLQERGSVRATGLRSRKKWRTRASLPVEKVEIGGRGCGNASTPKEEGL
eukprot:scaffold82635_cov17-Tisochrysis_lutea.AAC.1